MFTPPSTLEVLEKARSFLLEAATPQEGFSFFFHKKINQLKIFSLFFLKFSQSHLLLLLLAHLFLLLLLHHLHLVSCCLFFLQFFTFFSSHFFQLIHCSQMINRRLMLSGCARCSLTRMMRLMKILLTGQRNFNYSVLKMLVF